MKRILVVCIGNVCRSPMAERLLAARLGPDWEVASAGVGALVGAPIEPEVAAELTSRGVSPDGFAARQLTTALVAEADLVLTATLQIRSRVLGEAPAAMRRTFTLLELAELLEQEPPSGALADVVRRAADGRSTVAGRELDVADPYHRGPAAYRDAAERVDDVVRRLAAGLAQAV